ncbi:MAG: HAD hydrolase-like protein [Chitinophagales bacterium]
MRTLLITDLDNTLYNWVDYFGMSYRGMVHAVAKEMKISEEEFNDGAKEVFSKVGTLEYSFLIQELPFISRYTSDEIQKFISLAKKVFSIVRTKNLRPYPGVKETFEFLKSSGVIIVAVTNAPIFFGEQRIKQLNLDKYFHGILGWEGISIPDSPFSEEIRKKAETNHYQSKHIKHRWPEPKENIKPNPIGYLKVISSLFVSHKETYVIGDSLAKDILPANEIGAHSIWAKYGAIYEEKNFETLLKMTYWTDKKIKKEYKKQTVVPQYEVDSFSDLRKIVKGPQLNLFDQ